MDGKEEPPPLTREEWMKEFLADWKRRLAELSPAELAQLRSDTTDERSDDLLASVKRSMPPMPEK
jgi:hypothetical protein